MRLLLSLVLAAASVMSAAPVQAHHSQVAFHWMDRTVTITGVVKELRLVNPHGILLVEVTEPNGQKVVYEIGGPTASGMKRAGWSNTVVVPGDVVTVTGNPARNPEAHAIAGHTVTKADGTILYIRGGPGRGQAAANQ